MPFSKPRKTEAIDQDERKRRRDCASLVADLANTDPLVRRWAARDLADCDDASPVLVSRLLTETDASVRMVIFSTLTTLGDDAAVAGLIECLRSEYVATRNEAIAAMQQLPEKVAPVISGLLQDPNADVRIFAVNVLESLRHPDVESWLIEVIEQDDDVNVCATAVDLMSEVASTKALAALQRLKIRFPVEPYIQFAADIALKRIEGD